LQAAAYNGYYYIIENLVLVLCAFPTYKLLKRRVAIELDTQIVIELFVFYRLKLIKNKAEKV
jgi:hypothetical protein